MSVEQISPSQVTSAPREHFSRLVSDRNGKAYRLLISVRGERQCFQIYDRSVCVGEARCSWQDKGCMSLDDIAIANRVDPAQLSLIKRWQQLLGIEFEPISYRQLGLGTALLQSVIGYVRTLGAASLQGEVFQADLENNPALLDWYISQGFVRSAPRPEQVDVLANIILVLCSDGDENKSELPLQLLE